MDSFKCKNCGSNISYNNETKEIFCTNCDSIFNISDYKIPIDEKRTLYKCSQCGGELLSSNSNLLQICPFCDSLNIHKYDDSTKLGDVNLIPFKTKFKKVKEEIHKTLSNSRIKKRLTNNYKIIQAQRIFIPVDQVSGVTHSINYNPNPDFFDHDYFKFKNVLINKNDNINNNMLNIINDYYFEIPDRKKLDVSLLLEYSIKKNNMDSNTLNNIERKTISYYAERKNPFDYDFYYKIKTRQEVFIPVWFIIYEYEGKHYNVYVNGENYKVCAEVDKKYYSRISQILLLIFLLFSEVLFILNSFPNKFNTLNHQDDLMAIYSAVGLIVTFGYMAYVFLIPEDRLDKERDILYFSNIEKGNLNANSYEKKFKRITKDNYDEVDSSESYVPEKENKEYKDYKIFNRHHVV